MADFHRGFEDIDRSADDRSFFEFLDLAGQFPSVIEYRERMLALCPVTDGSRVLDVGCGLGNEARRIAARVGKTGQVCAIDSSASMINEAQRRNEGAESPVQFDLGDAHNLPFEDSSFDLCRAERVLLYLEHPAKAIAEMCRVVRTGGRVIVFDFDYGAFFIDSDFAPMSRRIEALLASDARNPAMARELPHLMRAAGLRIEAIEARTLFPNIAIARRIYAGAISKGIDAGAFTTADVQAWWNEQVAMEEARKLFHAHQGYIVAASRP